MSKLRNAGAVGGCLTAGITHAALGLLGLAIHLWAVLIAFDTSGFFSALITLALPVLAELFWGIAIWRASGVFFNLFTIAIMAYIGLWVVFALSVALLTASEE